MNAEIAYLLGRSLFNTSKEPSSIIGAINENREVYNTSKSKSIEIIKDPLYSRDFIRGMYESTRNPKDFEKIHVSCDLEYSEIVQDISKVRGSFVNGVLVFTKHNALDFSSFVYNDSKPRGIYSRFCFKKFVWLSRNTSNENLLKFQYKKLFPEAVTPFKGRASDSGYDLVLVKLVKRVGNTFWYSTGISVEPPSGFYFDIVPRSSLSKTGFMLANSVGIIDRSYSGDIIVALTQIDHTMPELELPFRAVQMIPRMIVHMKSVLVDEFSAITERGDKGFGSSGF